MKKINYLLLVIAAVVTLSCAKNLIEKAEVEDSIETGPTVTVTCTFAPTDTKVSIEDGTGAHPGTTRWQVGDEILIHGKKTDENVTVTLAAGNIIEDGKVAQFTVTMPTTPYGPNDEESGPNGYYAAYPASAYTEYSDGRGYNYNTFNDTNKPLMSAYYVTAENKFVFANLCGVLAFKVTGGDAYDEYMLVGKDKEELGYGRYVARTRYGKTQYYKYATASPLKSVRGPVVADGATENRIYIPNGVSFTSGFYIFLLKDGEIIKQFEYNKAISIPRSSYRPLPDITSYLSAFSTPSHTPAGWTSTATDLSVTLGGKANCYYLRKSTTPAESVYKFPAKQGNSETAVSGIYDIEVVWETYNTTTDISAGKIISNVDFDSDWIYFQMPATVNAGNALIAVRDIYGDILWSWHIWVPTDAVSSISSEAITTFIGGAMMNMNLGALEAVPGSGAATIESLGLLYQWGRKDPFVGAAAWAKYPTRAAVAGAAWRMSAEKVSIATSIKHPDVLYIDPAKDDKDYKDWNSSSDASLWNNSGSKSIYDPCPPGYKVPVNTGSVWTKTDTGWSLDLENHVWVNTAASVRIPLAGYIECYGGSLYGAGNGKDSDSGNNYSHAYLWSASSNGEEAYCMYVRAFRAEGSRYYGNSRGKANAGSVRCIAE